VALLSLMTGRSGHDLHFANRVDRISVAS